MEKAKAAPVSESEKRIAELRRMFERGTSGKAEAPAQWVMPFTLPMLGYQMGKMRERDERRFEKATEGLRERHGLEIALWPRLATAMEVWRRSVGVSEEQYVGRRTIEITNLFMVYSGMGDALCEEVILGRKMTPKCIYSARVCRPEELVDDFVRLIDRLIDDVEEGRERRELVKRLLGGSVRCMFESAVVESGIMGGLKKGGCPSVEEVLAVHDLKTGKNVRLFIEAVNYLHHIENSPSARRFAEVSYAMGRATQVLDDAKDIENDLRDGFPNLFVAAAAGEGELEALRRAALEGGIPRTVWRLLWLRGHLPKTYGKAMGVYRRFAKECEEYFGPEWKLYKAYSLWQKDEH